MWHRIRATSHRRITAPCAGVLHRYAVAPTVVEPIVEDIPMQCPSRKPPHDRTVNSGPTTVVTMRLEDSAIRVLRRVGDGNLSEGVRQLLRLYHALPPGALDALRSQDDPM